MGERLPRAQWKPILNEAGEQVGWNTGDDEIKFSSHQVFLLNEGVMQVALQARAQRAKQDHLSKRKKGKVAPKQRRGQG